MAGLHPIGSQIDTRHGAEPLARPSSIILVSRRRYWVLHCPSIVIVISYDSLRSDCVCRVGASRWPQGRSRAAGVGGAAQRSGEATVPRAAQGPPRKRARGNRPKPSRGHRHGGAARRTAPAEKIKPETQSAEQTEIPAQGARVTAVDRDRSRLTL